MVTKYRVSAELKREVKQAARAAYRESRARYFRDMRKTAGMILLAKKALPVRGHTAHGCRLIMTKHLGLTASSV